MIIMALLFLKYGMVGFAVLDPSLPLKVSSQFTSEPKDPKDWIALDNVSINLEYIWPGCTIML